MERGCGHKAVTTKCARLVQKACCLLHATRIIPFYILWYVMNGKHIPSTINGSVFKDEVFKLAVWIISWKSQYIQLIYIPNAMSSFPFNQLRTFDICLAHRIQRDEWQRKINALHTIKDHFFPTLLLILEILRMGYKTWIKSIRRIRKTKTAKTTNNINKKLSGVWKAKALNHVIYDEYKSGGEQRLGNDTKIQTGAQITKQH